MIAQDTRFRRVFSVAAAAIALALASPLIGLAALYLKLVLRGPVFVRDERAGRGGQAYRLVRLRTSGGGRLLEVLGIASLPELVNVLRGEMSLVGPRPSTVEEAAWYTPTEARLLAVRPGLISPAWRGQPRPEVGASGRLEHREAMAKDRLIELHYIEHQNAATDTVIVIRAAGWLVVRLVGTLTKSVWRVLPWVVVDTFIAAGCFFVAYFLRFLDTPRPYGSADDATVVRAVLIVSVGFAFINLCFQLHRRAWRYAAGVEMLPIAVSVVVSGGIATFLDVIHLGTAARVLPLGVILIGSVFSAIGFALFRYRTRVLPAISVMARPSSGAKADPEPIRAVVYGAGDLGQLLVRRLRTHPEGRRYRVVGFLDDDPRKHGLTVHGIKVGGGRKALRAFVAKEDVDVIVLAMGTTTGADMREILAVAQGTAAQIKVAHDVVNWMGDRYSAALLRDMRAEDLIGRQATGLDHARCRELVGGKTVLVTGACGSIGSELIRQILTLEPARIIAVDTNESGLYDFAIEMKALRPDVEVRLVVGDVTNRERMLELVRLDRPDVIFHVAAYKHVPLMELYPHEAVWTNVWGTWVMADAAKSNRCGHFVLVSTDKAVNPSSIMGASKRMAEILVHGTRNQSGNGHAAPEVRMTVVRFGNVLGSRGSVIPTFERQIELGGPVTVTHADMTRYFMHPEEASALIVEAASLSTADEVFMLDMGDRVRIEDLAYKMIRLRGLRPNVDIAIEYTGLRPGEKLHEELIYVHEHRLDTVHARVFQIRSQGGPSPLDNELQWLVEAFAAGAVDRGAFTTQLVRIAAELVDGRQSAGAPSDRAEQVLVGQRHIAAEATAPS
jgi:FlaA1/EpsC-like NDP-sugar epimerase/lipopolysaccharide/colanic/teichoic acid biosynthesis glycosyltransferase